MAKQIRRTEALAEIPQVHRQYFRRQYHGHSCGKARNLTREVNRVRPDVLTRYDFLSMPAAPIKPRETTPSDRPIGLYPQRAFEMIGGAAPFKGGLSAVGVPRRMNDALPIGMAPVRARYGEPGSHKTAHSFERGGDWREM